MKNSGTSANSLVSRVSLPKFPQQYLHKNNSPI
jgi:hypothetical protein